MYDAVNLGAPLTRFTAPDFRCSSFYVRMAISPDDQYIACGSTDKNIYIWEVDYPDVIPIVLKGHENEVTSLSWSKNFDTVSKAQHVHHLLYSVERVFKKIKKIDHLFVCFDFFRFLLARMIHF